MKQWLRSANLIATARSRGTPTSACAWKGEAHSALSAWGRPPPCSQSFELLRREADEEEGDVRRACSRRRENELSGESPWDADHLSLDEEDPSEAPRGASAATAPCSAARARRVKMMSQCIFKSVARTISTRSFRQVSRSSAGIAPKRSNPGVANAGVASSVNVECR